MVPAERCIPAAVAERASAGRQYDVWHRGGSARAARYKTTTKYFIGGLYVRDDGYVLSPASDTTRYYPLPTADRLSSFQQQGLLPDPLPPYELGAFAYANGYSLWFVVAITLLLIALPAIVRSRRPLRPT
jgi:hypothetical protein